MSIHVEYHNLYATVRGRNLRVREFGGLKRADTACAVPPVTTFEEWLAIQLEANETTESADFPEKEWLLGLLRDLWTTAHGVGHSAGIESTKPWPEYCE